MRRAAIAAAVRHENVAAVAAAPPVPPPVPPPGIAEAASAAVQVAATVSQQVLSVMMLAMVAAAVVSTVSMSALMVKRAQEAATPTPAAQLAALINSPTPTYRPTVARRERAPPVQQIVEESVSRSIQWAPTPPPPSFTPEIGRRVPQSSLKYTSDGEKKPRTPTLYVPPPLTAPAPITAPAPLAEAGPPECNVTYTKTIKTITLEPTGNVTHVETFSYMIPCAEAPTLPPAGAPDIAEPEITRTTRVLPHSSRAGQNGGPDADAGSPDGAPPPGFDPEARPTAPPGPAPPACGTSLLLCTPQAEVLPALGLAAPAPAPGTGVDSDRLAALLAADPSLAAQLALLSPGEAPSGGPSRLAALLAANPSLRDLLPPAAGEGPIDAGSNPDDAQVSYDVWGRPVTDPEAERAADAAENARPLATTRRDSAGTTAAREAEVARLRAEQRAWWDAELAKARAQTQGRAARPVDFSHRPGSSEAHEAHPREHRVAVDMAQGRLRSQTDTRWDMSDEIADFRERMEWKHHFPIGRPARRFLREAGKASARWRGLRRMMSSLVRGVVRWLRSCRRLPLAA